MANRVQCKSVYAEYGDQIDSNKYSLLLKKSLIGLTKMLKEKRSTKKKSY